MQIEFYKYQGTGNDFVMIDNRSGFFPKENNELVARLCDRRFGIGADGLILLENNPMSSIIAMPSDFRMVYYNSDGNLSSMCGNGGRCIVAFAKKLNIIQNSCMFMAADGWHHASVDENGVVSLKMIDVTDIKKESDYTFMNTGSPHHVQLVEDLEHYNVKENGAALRYGSLYGKVGSNINFVKKINEDTFSLRTYERGVEDETLACGTGATAVAIAMNATGQTDATSINLNVEGGKLAVSFDKKGDIFTNVFLIGPAEFVFKGVVEV
ncbi:diaminopimelate epimerase [Flavobacterium nackdongense]|uniref:Diaminopimelate epimerase n=1 Tax=Flavobacterium nackdongense TaxID=2547394 RepID=A0A4P6Y7G8_9FLAO|nr:diaminopimelate epimerase [Flavobacterium nackdongense]QBN18579.1 diaminopimelate epimerase [Flavobacterium nackdongense]